MSTKGNGHGKVILFGEHAVVHGVPAIAVGIERGVRATATTLEDEPSTLRLREWGTDEISLSLVAAGNQNENHEHTLRDDDVEAPMAHAFQDLLTATREAGVDLGPVALDVEVGLPPGGGLGCSAALGVAIARALDPNASSDVIAVRANIWERVFHGNPSGVDAAVSALGGCIQFARGDQGSTIERVRVPNVLYLCIGNTGQGSSTRSMVDGVARLLERQPETTRKTFDAIRTLVENARLAIEAGDRKAVGQLLDLNQMLLSGLFVSTAEIERMCGAARAAGALGAKLTGAGGGGCVVALVESPAVGESVLAAWQRDGFDGFVTSCGRAETP